MEHPPRIAPTDAARHNIVLGSRKLCDNRRLLSLSIGDCHSCACGLLLLWVLLSRRWVALLTSMLPFLKHPRLRVVVEGEVEAATLAVMVAMPELVPQGELMEEV
ncbi:MAG TPA: hypothetical protein PLJ27_15580 [Polyangiaceae bacterium]|nr:MAG: hypothetical protein BWY17_04358 [Deltaproteobacteria bacterium ADurb.Bin207]HNT00013.1 hypothetical protein [Polyangiaceae bacterium]HNZ24274.1 hypothetical protein [Polyangiaceae bacterium]HOD24805.1 hypothetical protein [Polyangiaceae bacterium]HOE49695.1 hypothetical protein [Polyangiaceae bacterium]